MSRRQLGPVDLGNWARGLVVNVDDWGGQNPATVRPRRIAGGQVTDLFPEAPWVVGIRTHDGEHLYVRRDLSK